MSNAQYIPGLAELGRKNQPGGYVGISSGGDVLGTFAQRVDTAANLATIVLASGELAYASDTREVFIGDGVTAGGLFLYQPWQTSGKLTTPANTMTLSFGAPVNSFTRPVLAGGIYEVLISADFSGDTSETSNFALVVHTNPANLDNDYAVMCSAYWHKNDAVSLGDVSAQLEAQHAGRNKTQFFLIMWPKLLTHLTESKAGLVMSTRFKMADAGTLSVVPMARATAPSAATCDLIVQHRRIA